jgi:Domain of unknown function (DUF4878)
MRVSLYGMILAAVATVVLAGCAKGPESTVENFYAAVGKGEITEAQDYFSEKIRGMLPPDKVAAGLTEEHKRVVACGGIKSVKVKLEGEGEVRFGTATVSYRGECPEKTEKVNLVQEQGKWKLSPSK